MEARRNSVEYTEKSFVVRLDEGVYIFTGTWSIVNSDGEMTDEALLRGQFTSDAVDRIHPADLEVLRKLLQAPRPGRRVKFSFRVMTAVGEVRRIEGHVVIEVTAGKIGPGTNTGVVGSATVFPKGRESINEVAFRDDDRYYNLLNASDAAYTIIELKRDTKGRVIDSIYREASASFGRHTGISNVVGRYVSSVLPHIEQSFFELMQHVSATGQPLRTTIYSSDFNRWYDVMHLPVGKAGTDYIASVFNDITERKRREAHMVLSREVSEKFANVVDIDDTMNAICGKIAAHLNVASCSILEVDQSSQTLIFCYNWCRPGTSSPSCIIYTPDNVDLLSLLRSGRPEVVNDVSATSVHGGEDTLDRDVGSYVNFPFVREGRWLATLRVTDTAPRHWKDDELELMHDLTFRIWIRLERARAEAGLRKSEKTYRTLFNSIDEAFMMIELIYSREGRPVDFRYLEVNHSFARHTGLKDVVGRDCSEVSPGTEGVWFEAYDSVIKTGESSRFEDFNAFTGRWYSAFAFPVGEKSEHRLAILFNDITARKSIEQRQKFLLKFNDALRFIPDPAKLQEIAADLLGEHLRVNRAWYAELAGEHLQINCCYHHGLPPMSGKIRLADLGAHVLNAFDSGEDFAISDVANDPRLSASERQQLMALNVGAYIRVPLMKGEQWVGMFAVHQSTARRWEQEDIDLVRDTSERTWISVESARAQMMLRQSEEQNAFLLKISDALRVENNEYAIGTTVTHMLGQYLGVDRCYIANISRVKDLSAVDTEYHTPGVSPIAGEYRLQDFPESIRQLETGSLYFRDVQQDDRLTTADKAAFRSIGMDALIAAALRLGEKNFVWALVVGNSRPRDWQLGELRLLEELAERTWAAIERTRAENALRRNEEQLRILNARLQETDKAKTNFFNNVSHEFRTPLTLLISPLRQVISDNQQRGDAERSGNLQLAYRNAIRLQKLVNQLLDFSRIETGKIDAFFQPTDFSRITTDLASNFRSVIEKAGLKFVVKSEQIMSPVYLNREMWEKIVFNLISNAFKFTMEGKIVVKVTEKKKTVELHVSDTGIGIAANNIERIFQRFSRIEGVKARTLEGTGIGLALVRELIIAHHGAIKVNSKPGKGSEFVVSIPKGKKHLDSAQIYEQRKQLPYDDLGDAFTEEAAAWLPEEMKRRKGPKDEMTVRQHILIADDNGDMRMYLKTLLENKYHVTVVENGRRVIEYLNKGGQADLILSDVMMPELDGYELVEQMKVTQRLAHIPILLISARSTEEAKIEGMDVGADDFLFKPFTVNELLALVRARIKTR